MRKIIFGFILGIAAGAWGYWYFEQKQNRQTLVDVKDSVVSGAGKVKDAIQDKVGEITSEDIKRELERTSMVVREKTKKAGAAISDATANARTTTAVKSKLIAEPGLSAFSINVDTTDGLVTLSGTVSSHDEIAKAVRIALETDGVHKVISTMQVKPAK